MWMKGSGIDLPGASRPRAEPAADYQARVARVEVPHAQVDADDLPVRGHGAGEQIHGDDVATGVSAPAAGHVLHDPLRRVVLLLVEHGEHVARRARTDGAVASPDAFERVHAIVFPLEAPVVSSASRGDVAPPGSTSRPWAISSAGERPPHTREVVGSNPTSPTTSPPHPAITSSTACPACTARSGRTRRGPSRSAAPPGR